MIGRLARFANRTCIGRDESEATTVESNDAVMREGSRAGCLQFILRDRTQVPGEAQVRRLRYYKILKEALERYRDGDPHEEPGMVMHG